MLQANEAVAEYMCKRELPTVYRVHENPDPDKLRVFASFARPFGYRIDPSKPEDTAQFQTVLRGAKNDPKQRVLPTLLPQRDTGHLPDANAADAVKATVNFQSGGATGFVYDDALAAYGMLHADGTPQLDANTGTQAVFDNLLILYSGSSLRDDGRTLDYDLSMGGGVWLNGGHLWQITWTQGTQSTLALYDSNGKPLNLPAGRSYIALLSSLTGQELLVQSSSGEALVGAG